MQTETVQLPVGDDPPTARLLYGATVLDALRTLPDGSVHVACTSPPYWGLRDYGVPPQDWPAFSFAPMPGIPEIDVPAQTVALGLEPNSLHFIGHLMLVFRELRRVLRDDGTLWMNLGDSYTPATANGLKAKDLGGIPWRAALALQADGWFLRNDIIWSKGNCMPEPVRDRCTRSHEYVFLLTKSPRYFYDADAVREQQSAATKARYAAGFKDRYGGMLDALPDGYHGPTGGQDGVKFNPKGRNKRTVWNVNPRPYPGAHFAVWPPDLVEPMVKAGSSERGCCPTCGAPWHRLTKRHGNPATVEARQKDAEANRAQGIVADGPTAAIKNASSQHGNAMYNSSLGAWQETVGWEPTCKCEGNDGSARSVVLDPFSGSATTGMVALNLDRDYIGIDLNDTFLPLARARILGEKPPGEVTPIEEGSILDIFG